MSQRRRAPSRRNMVTTSVALPTADHRRLVLIAARERTVFTALVRAAVRQWLRRRARRRGGRR